MSDQVIAKLNGIENRLDENIRKAASGRFWTLVVGLLLVAFMVGYFIWINMMIREMLKPDDLAGVISGQLIEQAKAGRPELEKAAVENAPQLLNDMIDYVVKEGLPTARKEATSAVKDSAKPYLDDVTEKLLDATRDLLAENEAEFRALAADLRTNEGRDAFEARLYKDMSDSLDAPEIQEQLALYGGALGEVALTIERLGKGEQELDALDQATFDLLAVVLAMSQRVEPAVGEAVLSAPSLEDAEKLANTP